MDALKQMLTEALEDKKREGKVEAYNAIMQFCRDQMDKLKIEEVMKNDRNNA